jgi:hypothetical protein
VAIYPEAVQALIPVDLGQDPYITPTTLVGHTAVSSQNGPGPGPHGGLEWHFYIDETGLVVQRRDTEIQADAQYHANRFAVSFESWDNGDPDNTPWTDAQLDAIVRLCVWLNQTHGIEAKVPDCWNCGGMGVHRMFSEWDYPYHSCPCDLREAQWVDIVIPRVQAILGGQPAPPVPFPPPAPPAPNPPLPGGSFDVQAHTLQVGSKGGEVKALQSILNGKAGQGLVVDGDFGKATDGAVRNWQRFLGLGVDGIVGPQTWQTLIAA